MTGPRRRPGARIVRLVIAIRPWHIVVLLLCFVGIPALVAAVVALTRRR